jgi:hypothetical protein
MGLKANKTLIKKRLLNIVQIIRKYKGRERERIVHNNFVSALNP